MSMELTFFERLNKIDSLIKDGPSKNNLQFIDSLLLENSSRGYFYDSLTEDIEWVKLLADTGKFNNITHIEARYLARTAPIAPKLVFDIILKIDTDNINVLIDFIDATLAMPPELAAEIIPKAKTWLILPHLMLLPEKLGQLAAYLAEGDQIDAALDLTYALLEPVPDVREEQDIDQISTYLEPKARYDVWDYQRIIEKHIPVLVKYTQEKALILLCNLLEKSA